MGKSTLRMSWRSMSGVTVAAWLVGCGTDAGPATPTPPDPPTRPPEQASPSFAYLTQAVQSATDPVPLVAGDSALLRVFVVSEAGAAAGASLPPTRVTFYLDDAPTHVIDLDGTNVTIPAQRDEGDLNLSLNAVVPGSVIRFGLEFVVEIDPDQTLDPALGIRERLPAAGRTRIPILKVPPVTIVLMPILSSTHPDSAFLAKVRGLTADSPLLWATREFLPIHELDIIQHDAILVAEPSCGMMWEYAIDVWHTRMEAGAPATDIWVGLFPSGCGGGAMPQQQVAVAGLAADDFWQNNNVLAHEIGHLMTLDHPPCNISRDDPIYDENYPHANGTIGAWGYDMRSHTLRPPDSPEVMSYCGEREKWISGHYFRQALRYRLSN